MNKLLLLALLTTLLGCRIEINLPPAQVQPVISPPVTSLPVTPTPGQQNQRPQSKYQSATGDVLDRYIVTAYIVGGDTLYSRTPTPGNYRPGINKLDINNFALLIEETGKDQYTLTYSYYHNKTALVPRFTRAVSARALDYLYEFTLATASGPTVYESTMRRSSRVFYEKIKGGGIAIPLAGASGPLDQLTDKEVIIVAMPQ
ncbi:hypothetical protein [Fibrella forsythiae]|uniref:DUF4136 domain-containing protein n=1 Tax=Fibrella forsythiae TaxID=2817061 RepID=A0ABS3JSN1_9BACT|nr:hypothetical protein [Fibrella forsythiae]MBO0953019.1 hypothetical protein [Fibrella forsythiae]